ncbi:CheY-like protein [Auricularia subglabra TFB-10046 SS5]|nr:CheY-like protein [Auricularia subglabra TFB-10046 SS5]
MKVKHAHGVPREAQKSTRREILEIGGKSSCAPVWSTKPRVLLVDDDVVSRTISSKFLKTFGCAYDVAQDGVVALEKIEGAKYDLILMDIVMPRLDGLSVTTLIRRFDPRTPIISMTGNAAPGDVLNYFSHGKQRVPGIAV